MADALPYVLAMLATVNTVVVVATFLKTAKVEKHTNGMQAQLIAFERKDAKAEQKADDGNT